MLRQLAAGGHRPGRALGVLASGGAPYPPPDARPSRARGPQGRDRDGRIPAPPLHCGSHSQTLTAAAEMGLKRG